MSVPAQLATAKQELDGRLTDCLRQMETRDWKQRQKGFDELATIARAEFARRAKDSNVRTAWAALFVRYSPREDQVRLGLIKLLKTENSKVRGAATGSLDEDYMEYFSALVGAVTQLLDPRAIPELLDDLPNGGPVVLALASFGMRSLDALLHRATDADMGMRSAVIITLSEMLSPSIAKLDLTSVGRIKSALVNGAKDKEYGVRICAIQGLAKLPDTDVTNLLKSVADSDPFSRPGAAGKEPVYPVRNAARSALTQRVGKSR